MKNSSPEPTKQFENVYYYNREGRKYYKRLGANMQLNGWCSFQQTRTIKRQAEPTTEMVSSRLKAMGLESTGNFEEDLQALRETRGDQKEQGPKGAGGPPPEIQAQLDKYGLEPQGSIEADLEAIKAAKEAAESSNSTTDTNTTTSTTQENRFKQLHEEFMQLLGLEPTGNIETDMAAIHEAMRGKAVLAT